MTTVWFVSDSVEIPEPVECEAPGYPNRDVKGRVMYLNSHYATEAEAWDFLLSSGRAGQDLARVEYEEAQQRRARAVEKLAIEAARRSRIEEGYEDFKRRSGHEPCRP